MDKIREKGFELIRKEAEGTPQKQLLTPTTLMTLRYWQLSKLDEPDMQDTDGEAETSS